MENKFKILSLDEVKIIKRVNIVTHNRLGNEITIGFILYERNFSDNYKFKETKEEDKDFTYFIYYPRQEDFPFDEIDNLILETIQSNYPKSFTENKLIFTTSDIEQLKNLVKRPFEKSKLIIRPDFTGQEYEKLISIEFKTFYKDIRIFFEGSSQLIKGLYFYGNCDFEKREEIYQKLDEIKFI